VLSVDLFTRPPRHDVPTLETLLCEPEWFGLTTASPVQRAICRVSDGLPVGELATDPDVIAAFGGEQAVAALPRTRCAELVLLAAIRCGKSLICAAAGVRAALSCDVSICGPGDVPRVSIVSLDKNTALQTWNHVRGRIEKSPKLSAMLIGKPTAFALKLRHPSGIPIEICVVAGSRAAGTLVARWSAGVILDEAPRMLGEEDGVVNIDHARAAVAGRLLPGAQVFMPGSPWAPFGPVYDLYDKHFGKPSPHLVVVHATGPQMNPFVWTPAACEELKQRKPDAYETDCMARFLDPESGLFASWELEECRRDGPLEQPARTGRYYSAAIDPATRGNAWALVILECCGPRADGAMCYSVALAKQWVGSTSKPLSPQEVFGEMAAIMKPYGLTTAYTDQWAADALVELAAHSGLWLTPETVMGPLKLEMMMTLRGHVANRTIDLPPLLTLMRDLASVKKKVTQTGVQIVYPQTGDGRHCDFAPAVGLALRHPPRIPDADPLPQPGTYERAILDAMAAKEAARLEVEKRNRKASQRWGRRY
jgi:hypothetical protein